MHLCSILALMFVGDCVLSLETPDQALQKCKDAFKSCGENCCDISSEQLQGGWQILCRYDGKTKTINVKDMTPAGAGYICIDGCRRQIEIEDYLSYYDCRNYVGVKGVERGTCRGQSCRMDFYDAITGEYLGTSTCLFDRDPSPCRVDGHKGTCKDGECVCKEQTDDKQAPSSKGAGKSTDAKSDPKSNTDKSAKGLNDEKRNQMPKTSSPDDKQAPSSKGAPKSNDAKSDPKSNTHKSAKLSNDEKSNKMSKTSSLDAKQKPSSKIVQAPKDAKSEQMPEKPSPGIAQAPTLEVIKSGFIQRDALASNGATNPEVDKTMQANGISL